MVDRRGGVETVAWCVYVARSRTGEVLYVGMAGELGARLGELERGAVWWKQVATLQVHHYDERADAVEAAAVFVDELDPMHTDPARQRRRGPYRTVSRRRRAREYVPDMNLGKLPTPEPAAASDDAVDRVEVKEIPSACTHPKDQVRVFGWGSQCRACGALNPNQRI